MRPRETGTNLRSLRTSVYMYTNSGGSDVPEVTSVICTDGVEIAESLL